MKVKNLYIATLALFAGLFCEVQAQDNVISKGIVTMEQFRTQNGWLNSTNMAGIVFNDVTDFSTAQLYYSYKDGQFRNIWDARKLHNYGVETESYRKFKNTYVYGKLAYNHSQGSDFAFGGTMYPESSIINYTDDTPGKRITETYTLTGGVGARLAGELYFGLKFDYTDGIAAKRKDLRLENNYMDLSIAPGFLYSMRNWRIGISGSYRKITDEPSYSIEGQSGLPHTYYQFEGLWFGKSENYNSMNFSVEKIQDDIYAGSLQLEYDNGNGVKALGQFTYSDRKQQNKGKNGGKYGEMEVQEYEVLGILNVNRNNLGHMFTARVNWSGWNVYNNTQVIQTLDGMWRPFQHGKILRATRGRINYNAEYRFFNRMDELAARYDIRLGVRGSYTLNSHAIYPVKYDQVIRYMEMYLNIREAFKVSDRGNLLVDLGIFYGDGGGHMLEGHNTDSEALVNYRYQNTYALETEYNYLTSKRLGLNGSVRYAHQVSKDGSAVYGEINGGYTSANWNGRDVWNAGIAFGFNF